MRSTARARTPAIASALAAGRDSEAGGRRNEECDRRPDEPQRPVARAVERGEERRGCKGRKAGGRIARVGFGQRVLFARPAQRPREHARGERCLHDEMRQRSGEECFGLFGDSFEERDAPKARAERG